MQNNIKRIKILDSSLREGEQMRGFRLSLDEKIALIRLLKDFGIRFIEIGHPAISEEDESLCKTICNTISDVTFLVHARAVEADILAAKRSGASWVGIWASCNPISLSTKFNKKSIDWIKEQVKTAIQLAKQLGLHVRFTLEDAARTELPLIEHFATLAQSAGADYFSLADTVGAWHPSACYDVVKRIVALTSCEIEVHLHNDLGLAQANAMAAIEAGATIVDASVLGIGERAGICDLFTLSVALHKFYGQSGYCFEHSSKLAQFIARCGGFTPEPHHPVIGKYVFTDVSKYHIQATTKNETAYHFLEPELMGRQVKREPNPDIRSNGKRYLNTLQVKKPFIKGASELHYHRDGVGHRWVLMDHRIDDRTPLYIIEREFDKDYHDSSEPHVDSHAHHCDSLFVFKGAETDGTGLTASVTFTAGKKEDTQIIHSPASIFIPAGIQHSYTYIAGKGRFLNIVLAPNYNQSLEYEDLT
jgi:2-isopropylmalate synthase